MLARLATKRAKPAGSYYLGIADAPAHVAELDVVDLHGFASAVRDKAIASFGTSKLRDLARESKSALQQALGDKSGDRVWNAIRGIDDRVLESDKPRKSVSADVNVGHPWIIMHGDMLTSSSTEFVSKTTSMPKSLCMASGGKSQIV